ncbi:hypothetical protein [Rhodopseudomonas pseudopalustris]|uniref:Uncharacterized protein n=2 Tax=Rhodopseudomonas TaxID=1073 RepID=Q134Y5_RHOPS|nr:hypothetical protein [Rhodopseudomonas pseudopalustris]ABE40354.1 hypothetical protein RPD_3128 [Rhodopseudomonas palustris BisB5]SEP11382.1 hypothetical protein SAMN05444123_108101 [Rhodopseudomonas pseudopalustris]
MSEQRAQARLAILRRDADMGMMKPILTLLLAAALVVPLGGAALAQFSPGALPSSLPPPPPPPPPPQVYVPVVPKLDAPQPTPRAQLPNQRRSFGDRITDCLTDGNAARLSPNDRAAYSRGCANQ